MTHHLAFGIVNRIVNLIPEDQVKFARTCLRVQRRYQALHQTLQQTLQQTLHLQQTMHQTLQLLLLKNISKFL
jgi:GTP cyclohydrolase I